LTSAALTIPLARSKALVLNTLYSALGLVLVNHRSSVPDHGTSQLDMDLLTKGVIYLLKPVGPDFFGVVKLRKDVKNHTNRSNKL
jgi:hypothetical protein